MYPNLITLAYLQTALPNLSAEQLADVPAIISAASQVISRRYPKARAATTYQEEYPVGLSRTIRLRGTRVLSVDRIDVDLNCVMLVQNTNAVLTRATVAVATTGEADALAGTGLSLVTTSAGVTAAPVSVAFAANPTVQGLANAVSALGNGWVATVSPTQTPAGISPGAMPSSEIRANQGGKSATGAGVQLRAYTRILNDWDIDQRTGKLTIYEWRAKGYSFPDAIWGTDPRSDLFRVTYTAGWLTVPDEVQRATVIMAQDLLDRTSRPGGIQSQRTGDYSYVLSPTYKIPGPTAVLLSPFKDRGF